MTDIAGAGVVVTGGGNGIGRAIARTMAAGGARVVVNDLDGEAAAAVAREIDGHAVSGDAASDGGVHDLIAAAREHLGAIDVYCANAGIGIRGGPEASDEHWFRAWDINVMAHVRASRALFPDWLERGSGTFVVTASAAGLLTMLGSAPYSVTKHAAVAYAEWLAATYRHRGIAVHCICPQGVRTQLLAQSGAAGDVVLQPTVIEPEEVADALLDAIAAERFLVLPHPEVHDYYVRRASDTDRWLAGMGKLQQQIDRAVSGPEA
ncbi:MAG TPA: SDR family oxidoreductase [Jiangellales bacterium]|nr:SDR family oxidoreductase [Jiangellales bacterium]